MTYRWPKWPRWPWWHDQKSSQTIYNLHINWIRICLKKIRVISMTWSLAACPLWAPRCRCWAGTPRSCCCCSRHTPGARPGSGRTCTTLYCTITYCTVLYYIYYTHVLFWEQPHLYLLTRRADSRHEAAVAGRNTSAESPEPPVIRRAARGVYIPVP